MNQAERADVLGQGHSFCLAEALFLRCLGIIFCIAFVSLYAEIASLIGSEGISPAEGFLQSCYERHGIFTPIKCPTLLLIAHQDWVLHFLTLLGAVLSINLTLLRNIRLSLSFLWILYLSCVVGGNLFMAFPWDLLLLEATFFAFLLTVDRQKCLHQGQSQPNRFSIYLLWWLLFRLLFCSGVVKLASGDSAWWSLSAFNYYFVTQPLPTPIAYYIHYLPEWLRSIALAATLTIELVLPFGIFLGNSVRRAVGIVFIAFQSAIFLTGNYGFFNLLTLALCLLLFDDKVYSRIMTSTAYPTAAIGKSGARRNYSKTILWAGGAFVVVALGAFSILYAASGIRPPASALVVGRFVEPFRLINHYGLFGTMARGRPEIVIQGSTDGREWREYHLHSKPGPLERVLPLASPMPARMDWLMWFAALQPQRFEPFLYAVGVKLLENESVALSQFEENPFIDAPPKYIRMLLFQYEFEAGLDENSASRWWKRQQLGVFIPPTTLDGMRSKLGQAR